ncbi:MAG: hypothetical protein ATN34_00020 [Epulopiscium sp. Nele67-Bin002]|nr:MAG: hypothetical protein BEN18_04185 [Epulopiscium sp. Nuni2H_MBin001]OON91283.1 MAG: hypothetical protein ATN34_00020 [Epulopiscium sp. Nele67-Bin002]
MITFIDNLYEVLCIGNLFFIPILIYNMWKLILVPNEKDYKDWGVWRFYPVSYYVKYELDGRAKYYVRYKTVIGNYSFILSRQSIETAQALIKKNVPLERRVLVKVNAEKIYTVIKADTTQKEYFEQVKSIFVNWIMVSTSWIIITAIISLGYWL